MAPGETHRPCLRLLGLGAENLASVTWPRGWSKETWVRILMFKPSGRVTVSQTLNLCLGFLPGSIDLTE